MERTKNYNSKGGSSYPIHEEPLVFSKAIFDLFLEERKFPNLIALYSFYYYTAKWQGYSQPRATTQYAANALGWGVGKLIAVKKHLKSLGLVEDVIRRDNSGKVIGHYIKINFISTTLRFTRGMAKSEGNTLNPNRRKILFVEKEDSPTKLGYITPEMFEKFWKIYPRKDSKGATFTKWNNICRRGNKRPTWVQIKQAIIDQKKSERWSQPEFIPLSSTWLNQSRWLDDPKELKKFTRKTNETKTKKDDNGTKYWLRDDGYYYTQKGTMLIE
jgi:hypothetical protein